MRLYQTFPRLKLTNFESEREGSLQLLVHTCCRQYRALNETQRLLPITCRYFILQFSYLCISLLCVICQGAKLRQRQVQIISLRIVRTDWSVSVTDPMLSSTSLTNVQKSDMRIAQCVSCILWVFSLMWTALLSITVFARQDITHTLHALHRALSQEFYLPPPTLLC